MEKKKGWFRRHWILSTILVIIVLIVLLGIIGGSGSDSSTTQETNKETIPGDTSDVTEPDSGATEPEYDSFINECDDLCEQAYESQGQTDVCKSTCANIDYFGNEGQKKATLNSIREIRDRE